MSSRICPHFVGTLARLFAVLYRTQNQLVQKIILGFSSIAVGVPVFSHRGKQNWCLLRIVRPFHDGLGRLASLTLVVSGQFEPVSRRTMKLTPKLRRVPANGKGGGTVGLDTEIGVNLP